MFKIADGLSILSNANAIYSNRKLHFSGAIRFINVRQINNDGGSDLN